MPEPPSQASRRRRYEHPVVKARIGVWPISFAERMRGKALEEQLALGGERQAPLVAVKQRRAEALLELLDARGDVRLHAVQPRGSLGDAAGLRDGLEDVQRGEVHDDLSERTTLS